MANSIGTLLVELGINTAAFVDGIDKATYKAKQGAKEIADAFDEMGSSLRGVLGQFGEFGAVVGDIFDSAASSMSSFAGGLGSLGGAMGALGVTAAAGAAALGAIVVAADSLALKSANSAAELYQLSIKTGVAVETLSELGFAARQTGVSTETLARSLALMNKSAFAAETAPAGAVNAYTRLGVSVTDASGHLKDSGVLFEEVSRKLAALGNAGERIALSKQIFGRGGSELQPLIVEAGDGLDSLRQKAKDLGLVMDTETSKAAEEFERDLKTLGEAGTGVGNTFLKELLPTFKVVSEQMIEGFKGLLEILKEYGPEIVSITKYFLSFADVTWTALKQVYDLIVLIASELYVTGATIVGVLKGIADRSGSEIKDAIKGGAEDAKNVWNQFMRDSKKDWSDYGQFVGKLFSATAQKSVPKPKPDGSADTTPGGTDKAAASIQARIDKLDELTKAELNLAAAGSKTAAEQLLLKAAGEADVFIKGLEAEAAKTTGAEHAKLTAIINKNRDAIHAWYAERAVAVQSVKLNEQLDKETSALRDQADALESSAVAYQVGGQAIIDSQVAAATQKQAEAVRQQAAAYDALSKMQGVAADRLAQEKAGLDAATERLKQLQEAERALIAQKLDEQVSKQTNAIRAEAAAYELTSQAAFKSAAAQREAAAQAAAAKFKVENPGASDDTLQRVHDNTLEQEDAIYQKTVQQIAINADLTKSYQDRMNVLVDAAKLAVANGQSTLLIDAQIYDEQNKINKEWDDAAIKVGTFGQKAIAVLDEVRQEGENMWGSIANASKTALDGMASEFAKFATTGKANFKSVFQGLEESVFKSGFQKLESTAAGGLLGAFGLGGGPGTAGKPDGSSEKNALWVQMAGSGFGTGGASNALSVLGGLGGGSGDGFSAAENSFLDGGANPDEAGGGDSNFLSGIVGGLTKGFGAVTGFFSNLFGGALAEGGDVTPGKAYLVGEKHPEFFMPGKSGSVVPTMNTGGSHTTNLSVHFHGVTDADSFKKSQAQIAADFHRQASLAYQRTM